MTAAEPLTTSASRRFCMVMKVSVKMMVGTAASSMPRLPPRARASWARTTASTVSVPTRVDAVMPGCDTDSGPQFVTRVEHDWHLFLHADPAFDHERAPWLDPRDAAAAQPDQGDVRGPDVQLSLKRRYAAARSKGHCAQGAAELYAITVAGLRDRTAAVVDRVHLEFLGFHVVAARPSAETATKAPFGLGHITSVTTERRIRLHRSQMRLSSVAAAGAARWRASPAV